MRSKAKNKTEKKKAARQRVACFLSDVVQRLLLADSFNGAAAGAGTAGQALFGIDGEFAVIGFGDSLNGAGACAGTAADAFFLINYESHFVTSIYSAQAVFEYIIARQEKYVNILHRKLSKLMQLFRLERVLRAVSSVRILRGRSERDVRTDISAAEQFLSSGKSALQDVLVV